MFKLIYNHKELKSLSWTVTEYNKLIKQGELKNDCYDLAFRLFSCFGFNFDIKIIKAAK